MNGHMGAHVKHMVVGGVGILVLLVILGVNFPQALIWALLLACPIGMIGMMWFMNRSSGHGHDAHAGCAGDHGETAPASSDVQTSQVPAQRAHHG